MPHHLLGAVDEVAGADDDLVMVGGASLRDHAGVGQLAVRLAVAFEADREGLHRLRERLGHERHHGAGVDAAAEERSERNVADQMQLDRLAQQRRQRFRLLTVAEGWIVMGAE